MAGEHSSNPAPTASPQELRDEANEILDVFIEAKRQRDPSNAKRLRRLAGPALEKAQLADQETWTAADIIDLDN
jgi:hypothetical protein